MAGEGLDVHMCMVYTVDLSCSGHGRIAVDIRGELTRPLVEVVERCDGLHTVSFVPQECCLHSIVITMNGCPVPGQTLVSQSVAFITYSPKNNKLILNHTQLAHGWFSFYNFWLQSCVIKQTTV